MYLHFVNFEHNVGNVDGERQRSNYALSSCREGDRRVLRPREHHHGEGRTDAKSNAVLLLNVDVLLRFQIGIDEHLREPRNVADEHRNHVVHGQGSRLVMTFFNLRRTHK